MRDAFFKLLPYVVGGVIGWLLVSPPDAFDQLGLFRPLVLVALAVVGLLVFVGVQLLASFPASPQVTPSTRAATGDEVGALLQAYRAVGFEVAGPPLDVQISPTATLWVLAHPELPIWASVFRTGGVPAKVGYDLFSVVEGDRGTLSTVADPQAAVFPLGPGDFKQLFPGASPSQLLDRHREALDLVRRRGVRFTPPQPERAVEAIVDSMGRQRRTLLANPMKASWLTLWRASTKQSPFVGPIAEQPGYEATIRHLQT